VGEVILTMKEIDKTFPGVHALDHVNFEVRRGEVHALMGENGSGKSTLMKVLTGIYKKDFGTITY
jgi:ribose transport system ATP-binding protein